MVDEPKISVIMSTFNPKELELSRSVQSIIDQSYTSWELLIYDDGSDSEGREIIEQMTKFDKRIRYLRGDSNRGIAVGLNECIKVSKGEYIARMDDDDVCLPRRFAKDRVWKRSSFQTREQKRTNARSKPRESMAS